MSIASCNDSHEKYMLMNWYIVGCLEAFIYLKNLPNKTEKILAMSFKISKYFAKLVCKLGLQVYIFSHVCFMHFVRGEPQNIMIYLVFVITLGFVQFGVYFEVVLIK